MGDTAVLPPGAPTGCEFREMRDPKRRYLNTMLARGGTLAVRDWEASVDASLVESAAGADCRESHHNRRIARKVGASGVKCGHMSHGIAFKPAQAAVKSQLNANWISKLARSRAGQFKPSDSPSYPKFVKNSSWQTDKNQKYKEAMVKFEEAFQREMDKGNGKLAMPSVGSYLFSTISGEEALGRGSFGAVTRVRCLIDGKHYALKKGEIPMVKSTNGLVSALMTDVQNQNETVPGLGQIYMIWTEFQPDGNVQYELMELGEMNLMDSVRFTRMLPEHLLWQYLVDSLRGLDLMHQRELVHCDIKTDNMIICADGRCKIVDYGQTVNVGDDSTSDGTYLPGALLSYEESRMPLHDIFALYATFYEVATAVRLSKGAYPATDGEFQYLDSRVSRYFQAALACMRRYVTFLDLMQVNNQDSDDVEKARAVTASHVLRNQFVMKYIIQPFIDERHPLWKESQTIKWAKLRELKKAHKQENKMHGFVTYYPEVPDVLATLNRTMIADERMPDHGAWVARSPRELDATGLARHPGDQSQSYQSPQNGMSPRQPAQLSASPQSRPRAPSNTPMGQLQEFAPPQPSPLSPVAPPTMRKKPKGKLF